MNEQSEHRFHGNTFGVSAEAGVVALVFAIGGDTKASLEFSPDTAAELAQALLEVATHAREQRARILGRKGSR